MKSAEYLHVVGLRHAGVLVVDKVDVALGYSLSNLGQGVGKLVIDVLLECRGDLQAYRQPLVTISRHFCMPWHDFPISQQLDWKPELFWIECMHQGVPRGVLWLGTRRATRLIRVCLIGSRGAPRIAYGFHKKA
jgi:hypothetical protein